MVTRTEKRKEYFKWDCIAFRHSVRLNLPEGKYFSTFKLNVDLRFEDYAVGYALVIRGYPWLPVI